MQIAIAGAKILGKAFYAAGKQAVASVYFLYLDFHCLRAHRRVLTYVLSAHVLCLQMPSIARPGLRARTSLVSGTRPRAR